MWIKVMVSIVVGLLTVQTGILVFGGIPWANEIHGRMVAVETTLRMGFITPAEWGGVKERLGIVEEKVRHIEQNSG